MNGLMESRLDHCSREAAKRVLMSSIGVFAITSIHHGYGAYVYSTPWRLHAAAVSGATTLILGGLLMLTGATRPILRTAALWSFVALALVVPFLGFGIFEGGYNHLVKDALYLGHASPQMMQRMFPPPRYEQPNNFFFELSGVLQIIPGVMTGYYLFRMIRFFPLSQVTQVEPARH